MTSSHLHNQPPMDVLCASTASSARARIPEGSWDSHMHVIDPVKFPLAKDAQYSPESHTLEQALDKEAELGFPNIVLVQPSIYGHDNSCLIDALQKLGPRRARAVVTFDPETIDNPTLLAWHALGVRGVRLNFQSVGKQADSEELVKMLRCYANIVRPLQWVIQLYIPLAVLEAVESIIPYLGVPICLDHFGCPALLPEDGEISDLDAIPGFPALKRVLDKTNTFVKLSAHYRLCTDLSRLEPLAKALLSIDGGRKVVFATDWPHTRFPELDIVPFVQAVLNWCEGNTALATRVFRDNARALWDCDQIEYPLGSAIVADDCRGLQLCASAKNLQAVES